MDCKDKKETLIQYSLGDLPLAQKESLENHLEECGECRSYLAESNSLWILMESWDEVEPEGDFVSSFWDKAKTDNPQLKPGFLHWIRDVKFNWTLAGAMASIFLVCVITFGAFDADTRNSLFMSTDERDEQILSELDNAIAQEITYELSIYGPWDSGTYVNANGGVN